MVQADSQLWSKHHTKEDCILKLVNDPLFIPQIARLMISVVTPAIDMSLDVSRSCGTLTFV